MSMCYWCRRQSYCQAMEKVQYKAVNDCVMYCEIFDPVALPVISMGRTSPPWVNEAKSVTRRYWTKGTSRLFRKDAYYIALSKQRLYGGQALGIGRMTANPFEEKTGVHYTNAESVERFYKAEGFEYLDSNYNRITNALYYKDSSPLFEATKRWIKDDQIMTVVPFEVIEVFPTMKEKYSTDEEIIRCVKALVKVLA